jgi:hypothetical protein
MKTCIEVIVPFRDEDEVIEEQAEGLIESLIKSSGKIDIPLDDFGKANLNISKLSEDRISELKSKHSKYFEKGYLSVISFYTEITFEEIYSFHSKSKPLPNNEELNKSYLVGLFESRLVNFLIFTQIALPGSLYTYPGFLLEDGEVRGYDFNMFTSNLVGWAFYDNKNSWPSLKKLDIKKVWSYILDKTTLLTASSKTNIENGLSAFSYLIDKDDNSANSLFWAMAGIEALYADGDIGIGYQIDNKSKEFLGEPSENKRVLKNLYNYRSKFLHGRMSLPINHGWIHEGNYPDKHEEEIMDMAFLASKLLISTLQEIITRGLVEFQFKFNLSQ